MTVISSLMYAAASVALFALIVDCCLRRFRLRDSPHVIGLSVMNNGQHQVLTSYPIGAVFPSGSVCPPGPAVAPYPATTQYPMPMPLASCNTSYQVPPYSQAVSNNVEQPEAPPPSYEQVMASERGVSPPPPHR